MCGVILVPVQSHVGEENDREAGAASMGSGWIEAAKEPIWRKKDAIHR